MTVDPTADGGFEVDETGVDRRAALKKGLAAAGAAGVVWAAPKVDGLSLRPAYAQAQTRGPGNDLPPGGQNFVGNFSMGSRFSSYTGNLALGTRGTASFQVQQAWSFSGGPVTETVTLISAPAGCAMQIVNFNTPVSADADGGWAPGTKTENANVATQVFNPVGFPSDPVGANASITFHCV